MSYCFLSVCDFSKSHTFVCMQADGNSFLISFSARDSAFELESARVRSAWTESAPHLEKSISSSAQDAGAGPEPRSRILTDFFCSEACCAISSNASFANEDAYEICMYDTGQ